MADNKLYYGDNLDILRRYVREESVDLIYLDPPFNSNQNYNVLFAEHNGSRSSAQIRAFEDTWQWDQSAAVAYDEVIYHGPTRLALVIKSLRDILSNSDMMAYLCMMAQRLIELQRVLKPTGSLYLHCDPTASHYLKLVMDAVMGARNFRNEIIWRRYRAHNDVGQGSKHFGRVHDVLLFYSKTDEPQWNQVFTPLDPLYVEKTYRLVDKETGRKFTTTPLTGPGGSEKGNPVFEWKGHTRAWRYSRETMEKLDKEGRLYYSRTGYVRQKLYIDESRGVPVQDEWTDITSLSGVHAERMGYPTQKPIALLERVINASSNPGDLVLDPFCGCGTTIAAAQKLGRRWIGIDITHLAITLMKNRLRDSFGDAAQYDVVGEPVSLPDAQELASEDPYQFQWWALGLVGARPAEQKKGADKGIDGRLFFHDEGPSGKTKQIIFSVKSGHLTAAHVRDLRGVIEREEAAIGVLLAMEEPTQPMRAEAAGAGFYTSTGWDKNFPRLQILTIAEILSGRRVDYPPSRQVDVTFKKAPDAKPKRAPRKTEKIFRAAPAAPVTSPVPEEPAPPADKE